MYQEIQNDIDKILLPSDTLTNQEKSTLSTVLTDTDYLKSYMDLLEIFNETNNEKKTERLKYYVKYLELMIILDSNDSNDSNNINNPATQKCINDLLTYNEFTPPFDPNIS